MKLYMKRLYSLVLAATLILFPAFSISLKSQSIKTKMIVVDSCGWANNSVNVTVFRKNSLVSFNDMQYIAFYDKDGYLVLGKRRKNSETWEKRKTVYQGNVKDAHNIISIMIDGEGYLHVSWDHHASKLNYCRSISPGSLELTDNIPMTGKQENSVTYPEFYTTPGGDLLFLYRDGRSGNGNLVINKYITRTKTWKRLHDNLIDGEGKQNAYWQACMGKNGDMHISWVWRASSNVESNHDLCYAVSRDGGETWEKSTGVKYQLPINASTAEYICIIPQKSELINQTSMTTDEAGHPFIATYWKEKTSAVPQYHVVYKTGDTWKTQDLSFRKTPFSLSGSGTKRIPVSRPQILVWNKGKDICAAVVFRDEERGNCISMAVNTNLDKNKWLVKDLTNTSVGSWEPSYDTELWRTDKVVSLFVQFANQQDSEGITNTLPQVVSTLNYRLTR